MAKRREGARIQKNALTGDEAERLFETVDETGHTNEETARKQRSRRREVGQGVDVDPLASVDPSGSNVEKVITRTAVSFVLVFLVVIVAWQVAYGVIRRSNTADLSNDVNLRTVAMALSGGVEWGNGFTQFPEEYSVQEADENTHRVEVTVTDTSSDTALQVFAGSQIQASALAVNALLNPNVNTVIYHVNVHMGDDGKIQHSSLFGFLQPTGEVRTLMTFIWTKTTTDTGEVRFHCTITGVDDDMQAELRDNITSQFTPTSIISLVTGDDGEGTATADGTSDATAESTSATDATSVTDATDATPAAETSSTASGE